MATDDDETVLEIYNAMMQRVLLILNEYQEYEGSDRHTMDHENVLNDLDDEDQLTRSGEPKLRRVYVKESIEEFASVLKRYYKHASKSATGDIQGPNCVVVGVFWLGCLVEPEKSRFTRRRSTVYTVLFK